MMDRKAEPEIRFKGFTDSWEQRKLSELVDVCSGMDYKHLSEGNIPVYGTGGYMLSVDEALSYDKDAIGIGRKGTIDKPYILKAPFWTVDTLFYCIPKDSDALDFVYDLFQRVDWKNKDESTGVPSLSKVAINDTDVMTPSKLEQLRIGTYFKDLDNLITLHQRKCDKLCDFKKALLCNMFPAAEADAPKVRFKGYTKPWKHWTLGELYTERKEAGNDDLPILSVSIHSGVSADELDSAELGKAVRRSEDKSLYKHTYKGDLVFNMMRAWQGAIGVVPKEGMVSPAYITAIPNDEVFPEFMDYCLRREEVINQINNLSYGVTDFRKRLYWDSFVRVQIMLPSVEEQKKITATLVQLDELIELQSAKVERLKNLKAACLEKMFV